MLEAVSNRDHGVGFRYHGDPGFRREGNSVYGFCAWPLRLGTPSGEDAAELGAPHLHVARNRIAKKIEYITNINDAVEFFADEEGAVLAAFSADARNFCVAFLCHMLPNNQAVADRANLAIVPQGRQGVRLFGLGFKEGTGTQGTNS